MRCSCARLAAFQLGAISPRLAVPGHIPRPSYAETGVPASTEALPNHNADDAQALREAAQLVKRALDFAGTLVDVGVSGDQIDREVHSFIVAEGAYPAPLNYMGFPKSICHSVNEVVCHGIPDDNLLRDGDIVSIDISVFTAAGFFGDACRTYMVGDVDDASRLLVERCQQITIATAEACGPGVQLSMIGDMIEDACDDWGYESVQRFCGHGIGQFFHMQPLIHHVRQGWRGNTMEMRPGMCFTIEPMMVIGSQENKTLDDGWTVLTDDRCKSAQFEHMVLITEQGREILTL